MLDSLRQYVSAYLDLTNEEFSSLTGMLEIRNFDKKEPLVRAGEVENYLNFLVTGLARMYFIKGKTEVITHIARENELISSSASFLSGNPSPYIVEALEQTTFLSISRQNLEKLYHEIPRMERLGRMMTTYFYLQKEEWELESLRIDARERLIRFVEKNPDLMKRVPHKYLASYLNMKPETFSRLKNLPMKQPSGPGKKEGNE
ncbi:Crp/Fnr family transcriptional regulator [Flavitalea flava]